MREASVIRLSEQGPVWYPPGATDSPRDLNDPLEREQLAAHLDSRRAQLLFAVPGGDVTLREVSISQAERRHVAKSLPFLLEDEFAGDVDGLHFASRQLGKLELGVAACSHDAMAAWSDALADLPDTPQWIPEPLLLPWQAGELCLVVESEQIVVRSAENEGFAAERELAAAMLSALPEDSAEAVIVYGRDQNVDTSLLPAWMLQRMQWRTGGFAEALMLSDEHHQPLNIRTGDYGPNLPVAEWWRQWRVAVAVVGAAFVLQVGSSYASYAALKEENLELRRQIQNTYRDVAPRGAVVDAEKQLKRQLDELRGGKETTRFIDMVDIISQVIVQQSGAQVVSLNFSDKLGDVRLSIVVPDFRAVESIREALVAAGLTAVTESSNASGSVVRARLKVGRS